MISLASKHEAIATSPLPPSPPGKDRGMKTPLEAAHSPFGGSVAGRILRCPASVGLVEKVPLHLRRESAYAKRGTALHIAIARVIKNECSLEDLIGETIDPACGTETVWVGSNSVDVPLTLPPNRCLDS